jgi:hypothetical protein
MMRHRHRKRPPHTAERKTFANGRGLCMVNAEADIAGTENMTIVRIVISCLNDNP